MKSVLISIQPKWCELIASGKKTVEVRKTRPKIETPFKCYIYCTADRRKSIADTYVPQTPLFVKNGRAKSSIGREDGLPWKLGNGKVIGEFVCDRISYVRNYGDCVDMYDCYAACMSANEIIEYAQDKDGNFVYTYGWHISDLVIYDKPRALSEFKRACPDNVYECVVCRHSDYTGLRCTPITKPPQSWCYVEGEGNE